MGCGIDRELIGSCSMLMVRGKLPANEPYPARLICHPHSADWTRFVLQVILGASEVKLSGPGPPCSRPIRTNGSARFPGHQAQAMVITGENCGKR